jgi:hypothetical protein
MIYNIPITRSEHITREFSVSAESPEEAVEKALQKAYDYEWPRGEAAYETDPTQSTNDTE